MTETVFHAGCPWVRMYPSTRSSSGSDRSVAWHVSQSDVVQFEEAPIQPLSPAVEAQLEMHRRQGTFRITRLAPSVLVVEEFLLTGAVRRIQ